MTSANECRVCLTTIERYLTRYGVADYEQLAGLRDAIDAAAANAKNLYQVGAPTDGQARVLEKFGYTADNFTKAEACELIARLAANDWKPLSNPKGAA